MLRNHMARMLVCLILCINIAHANDDLEKLTISSQSFEYRQKEGIATYQGAVEAVQGTRRLNGDKLEVYRGTHDDIEKIIVYGKPATHESLPNPQKPMLHARANKITYDTITKKLLLQDAARVEQGGDIYEAPFIEYDTTLKWVRSPEMKTGRTVITLQPRE